VSLALNIKQSVLAFGISTLVIAMLLLGTSSAAPAPSQGLFPLADTSQIVTAPVVMSHAEHINIDKVAFYAPPVPVPVVTPAPVVIAAPAPEPVVKYTPEPVAPVQPIPEPEKTVAPPATPVIASKAPAPAIPAVPSVGLPSKFAQLRQCESGGNYSINTGNGYYGAYQFNQQTWNAAGGTGLPSNASPAEQDARALALYNSRGWQPWTCAAGY
jgi:hypothetical protein